MKKAVEAAEHAAKVTAEAAKSAAVLVTKNSDAVNKLFQTIHPSAEEWDPRQEEEDEQVDYRTENSEESSESEKMNDIAKHIVSQNRYTHVVLSIMLVLSFVWRYVVVKAAERMGSKVSDPWGYVAGMLPYGFKGQGKEAEKSEGSFTRSSMPQKALLLLHGEREKEVKVLVSETNVYSALEKFCRLSQIAAVGL